MAVLVLDCPHCAVQRMTFECIGANARKSDASMWFVFGECGSCNMPVCAMVSSRLNGNPVGFHGNLMGDTGGLFQVMEIIPSPRQIHVPKDIPEAVARTFKQAAESRRAGHLDAACSMYRKAMELGLKAFSPDIEAWKIEKRIDKMAAEHRITPELQAWAHELRLDGNDAVHGDEEATADMAAQMDGLCTFLLTYLYTLPAQVAAAQARRAA